MANAQAATGLTVQQWDAKFYTEYVRQNRYRKYMGTDENAIIQLKEDLTKKKGDSVTFALLNRLTGEGTEGSDTLEGNEEDLVSRSHKLTVNQIRHAVVVTVMEEQKSAIPLRNAARAALKVWIADKTRDGITDAFASVDGVKYASATEVQKDAWLVNNADRVLFGAAKSNNSSNDHSASLGNIDNTNDKLTAASLSLLKRIATSANPKLRPVLTTEDEQWFIVYVNSLSFRDLKEDTTIKQAQREALPRAKTNPLFTGGDLVYDGMIVKEIEDIAILSGVGAGGIDVGPAYLCGAQAVGVGWAQRSKTVTQKKDYDDKMGVAVGEIRGIEKLTFGSGSEDTDEPKDNGIVTGFFAAVADS